MVGIPGACSKHITVPPDSRLRLRAVAGARRSIAEATPVRRGAGGWRGELEAPTPGTAGPASEWAGLGPEQEALLAALQVRQDPFADRLGSGGLLTSFANQRTSTTLVNSFAETDGVALRVAYLCDTFLVCFVSCEVRCWAGAGGRC